MKKRKRRSSPRLHAFLQSIREFPHIGKACKAAGISRSAHYRRYERDKQYAAAFDQAWRWGCGVVRDEAIRRALLGYEEPVIYQGAYQYQKDPRTGQPKLVTITRYPERLMSRVLGAEIPDVYNRQRVELTGRNGKPIEHAPKFAGTMEELLALYATLIRGQEEE